MPTWDDGIYITENPVITHLDFASIKTLFTTSVNSSYVPIPLLTFAIEYKLFGYNPFAYHLTNLILYLICSLLVFQIFRLLNLEPVYAALGALLFGIHPMHVESVAWITERKDLLYGLFYLASIIAYLKYIRGHGQEFKFFMISLLFFVLALFSKIQAVVLPLSLLLIDYYSQRKNLTPLVKKDPTPYRPLRREGVVRLFIEKIPYFVLALVFGLAGILILKEHGGLQNNEFSRLSERIFFGLYALSTYIVKFFAPFHLSAFYPYPEKPLPSLPILYYLNPVILFLLAFLIYRTARHTRAIVFGTLFFLVNIIFMLQILVAGSTYLSDRYSFIPYIGFCFIAGWGLKKIMKNKKEIKTIIIAATSIVIILFISLTFNRCKIWNNGVTLWTDVIEKYPTENAIPYITRGIAYGNLGQWKKAVTDYSKAIEIDPKITDAYSNRGIAYGNMGQFENAIADFTRAIGIDLKFARAYSNRGLAYAELRMWDKAIADYSKAIEFNPKYATAYFNRGCAYGNLGQWDKAISDFSRTIEIDPNYTAAYSNRDYAYTKTSMYVK